MDRQTRRNIKHDRFVDEVTSVASLAKENARTILIAVLALVVIGGGAFGWVLMKRHTEEKAQTRLAEGIDILEGPLAGTPGANPADAKYKTEQEKNAAAEKVFNDVIAQYESTDAADVAQLFLAQVESSQGKYSEARTRFEAFIKNHPDHVLADSARIGLVQLQIAEGKAKEAIAQLQGELGKPDRKLPADVLLKLLANAYEVTGDTKNARATWQRIANEFPDSPYGIDAQRKLTQG